jgi:hypothetical protein
MRTRLGFDARFEEGFNLFLQVQDVRYWGEETSNRDKSADAVDFHQAYLEVEEVPGLGGTFRAGRQEVSLAENRFISAPNWGQAGQSFDGVRWIRPVGEAKVEVVYLRLQEGSSDVHDTSADFMAGWLTLPPAEFGTLDFLAIHDRTAGPQGTGQSTLGSIWKGSHGPISLRAQGMFQFGARSGVDVAAFMVAGAGTLSLMDGAGTITLWYDHLSGDSRPGDGETGAFSTLFGARHRFYGRSDYFTDIPEDTGGLGLRDLALKLALLPAPLLQVNVDFHAFRTAEQGFLSSRHLAEEIDIWVRYRFRNAMAVEGGYSVIWAGTAMEELERLEGTGNMAYLMTSLAF